jgi:hypothetical protein
MTEWKERLEALNCKLNSMPAEEIQEQEKKQLEKTKLDFRNFCDALSQGRCHYCDQVLGHFSQWQPCYHWLLKPKGFKKKHFPILFEVMGFRQINTYLRWVANSEHRFQNINDLECEKSEGKFIEESIAYKKFEWSFSCSYIDRVGHSNSQAANFPHYHFQMRIDGMQFINYSDFHIPFSDYDEFSFAVEEGKIDRLRAQRTFDAGMQEVFAQEIATGNIFDSLQYTKDEENAAFNTEIILIADEGTYISGEEIARLFEEREQTGVSLAKLAKKLPNVSLKTYTTAGKGVPKIAARSKRKGSKK